MRTIEIGNVIFKAGEEDGSNADSGVSDEYGS